MLDAHHLRRAPGHSIFQERLPSTTAETPWPAQVAAHSALSIFRRALAGIICFKTKLHRCEDGAWSCRAAFTLYYLSRYRFKVILRTSRHATADADHRAGYVNTDNCVTRAPFSCLLRRRNRAHHVCGQGRNSSYTVFRSVATCE